MVAIVGSFPAGSWVEKRAPEMAIFLFQVGDKLPEHLRGIELSFGLGLVRQDISVFLHHLVSS